MDLAIAKTLKVGDIVCDCRYRHIKIASIQPEYLDDAETKYADLELMLEDGQCCSAVHCCSVVPHDWEHPI